jgi:hypothetical protein
MHALMAALLLAHPARARGADAAPNELQFCVYVESDLHGGAFEYFTGDAGRRPEKIRAVGSAEGLAGSCDAVVKLRQEGSRGRIGHASADVLSAYTGETLLSPHAERFWLPPSASAVADQVFAAIRPGTDAYARLSAQRDEYLRLHPPVAEPAEAADDEGSEDEDAAAPAPAAPAPPAARVSAVDRPSYSLPEDARKFAVIVGIEEYRGLPPARFAARDARAVRAHLQALGVPARNIAFLEGAEATRAGLSKTLNAWLPNRVKKDSTVYFYYSGHGAPDPRSGRAFLVPVDGDPEYLEDTAYPLSELYRRLGALGASHVLVALDSCFSGAGGRSVLAKDARPLVARVAAETPGAGLSLLTASDGTQISGALDDEEHGAFTYYLLQGLNGAAAGKDGAVTAGSLLAFLKPKVEDAARMHNRDQTPQLSGPAALRLR